MEGQQPESNHGTALVPDLISFTEALMKEPSPEGSKARLYNAAKKEPGADLRDGMLKLARHMVFVGDKQTASVRNGLLKLRRTWSGKQAAAALQVMGFPACSELVNALKEHKEGGWMQDVVMGDAFRATRETLLKGLDHDRRGAVERRLVSVQPRIFERSFVACKLVDIALAGGWTGFNPHMGEDERLEELGQFFGSDNRLRSRLAYEFFLANFPLVANERLCIALAEVEVNASVKHWEALSKAMDFATGLVTKTPENFFTASYGLMFGDFANVFGLEGVSEVVRASINREATAAKKWLFRQQKLKSSDDESEVDCNPSLPSLIGAWSFLCRSVS